MAEAAANQASYVVWTTWPENVRQKMIDATRTEANFLGRNEGLLNDTNGRREAILFLPFRRWIETNRCAASALAAALTRSNVQYEVLCEDNFQLARLRPTRVLLAESLAVFTATEAAVVRLFESAGGLVLIADQSDWLDRMSRALRDREIVLSGPSTLRAYVRDDARRTVVHLLNLGIARLSSFTDQITPASDVRVAVRVPFKRVRAVEALTADNASSAGKLQFSTRSEKGGLVVETIVPKLEIATMLVIKP